MFSKWKFMVATAVAALAGALAPGVAQAHTGGPNWGPIVSCESGGDPTAQNPVSSASGLHQFIDSTWRAYGGGEFASRAKYATPAEQYVVANRAYAAEGYRPWAASESCWEGRINRAPAPTPAAPPAPAVDERAPTAATHVVVRGDTLGRIAAEHGVTWRELHAANRGHVDNPHLIFPGQVLTIP